MKAEKLILDGYKSSRVMQAAAALAAGNFDRLDEIEKSLALLDKLFDCDNEQPNTDELDAVRAF